MRYDSLLPYSSAFTLFGTAHAALECSPSSLAAMLPSNASVNFAYPLKQNATFEVPKGDTGYPQSPVGLPELCAVSVQVMCEGNTTFGFGLFLPKEWNGRFLAVGNGGFAGGVNWADMASGTRYGFATMSTDTGHNASSGDGSWAYNHPDVVANWGYRAMHGSVTTAKLLTNAYYTQDLSYSYYLGCSTGGRQGLKEASFYPSDFNGIIAGAPAWWTKRMQPWTLQIGLSNLPSSAAHHIPSALFPVIAAEVLRQCDAQDGVTDHLVSDPLGCNFRPEALLCVRNATSNCLTAAQLETLDRFYSDARGANNTFYFPGLTLGTESQWLIISDPSAPNTLGTDYVKYFLGLGPGWDFYNFSDEIYKIADEQDPGNSSVDWDLENFQKNGGKLLMYHGLGDGLIPPKSSILFYEKVFRTMAPRGVDMDEFLRMFLVPGMGHCAGTFPIYNAPWYFAGSGQSSQLGSTVSSVPGYPDPDHDVLLSMMRWVENGTAPEQIIATKYADERAVGSGNATVQRQRPLCVYPKQARYMSGDVNSAKSWECR